MSRVYLFGLGSPFGADRLGWIAIEQLRAHFSGNPGVVLDALSQPMNIFIHTFKATDRIIFIDAMISGRAPGAVQLFNTRQLEGQSLSVSSHGIDLKTTVDLLIGMGFTADRISVFGIEMISDDALPGTLENAVQAACIKIIPFMDNAWPR